MLKLFNMKLSQKLSPKIFWLSQAAILFLGLTFLGTLYYLLYTPGQEVSLQAGPVTSYPRTLRIDLDQPDDNVLTFSSSLLVSGSTLADLPVLISSESQDSVVLAGENGSFSTVIKLSEGVNNLTVVVFDPAGETKQLERTVYYSKEKISIINFIIPTVYAVESTPSAEIKSKLEELKKEIASKAAKFKQAVSQKLTNKAYVGKVENTTETSATLITKSGAKIISFNKDTVRPRKLSQGDHVAALGDIDDTEVLNARKILLLPKASTMKTYLWGGVVSRSGNLLMLKDKNFNTHSISMAKVSLPKEVKINKFVVVSGFAKDDILEASFIFVIP